MIFLLLGIVCVSSSIVAYGIANFSTEYNIPKGAIWIGLGPNDSVTPNRTRIIITASLPEDSIDLQVYFNFSVFRTYYVYITMPYTTLRASSYVEYMSSRYTNETSQIGNITTNFKTFEDKGSSVINATFTPNEEFAFFPGELVAVSIFAEISGLVSIRLPLWSKQTIIMTFFGDETGVWDDEMVHYIGINTYPMIDYPFQAIVQFPKENYLSSDTFPNPIELFITERFRSAIFELDFSHPKGHAQTLSFSYVNPANENTRQFTTFISGTLLTLGITLCLESYREKRREKEMSQDRKPKDQVEKPEETCNQIILRLIRLVDKNFKLDWTDRFLRGGLAFVFVPFFIYLVLITVYLFFAPLQERISIGLSLLAVAIALLALISRFGEEHIVNVSLSKFGICCEEDERPLLIALIKMKNKNPMISLEQVYNRNESMFHEERLLEKLYD